MAEQRVNTFSTFLKTVQESGRSESQQQYRGGGGGAVQRVLDVVMNCSAGIEARELLDQSGVSVIDFGQAVERLQKLGALVVETSTGREIMTPGPQAGEILSLIK